MRAKDKDKGGWGFDLVAEVTERTWIVWVLKRMREANEEKVCSVSSPSCRQVLVLILFPTLAETVDGVASRNRMPYAVAAVDR